MEDDGDSKSKEISFKKNVKKLVILDDSVGMLITDENFVEFVLEIE